MKFLSVCSGIEAASCAWEPLGWKAHAFSEIEAFPSAVLAHHYSDTPNWGGMTKFAEWPDADVDVLVGGTPCQSFSIAGPRKGMADPRGNLALTFLAIASKYAPRWILWENVPGVLSSEQGRDFGAFLGGLGQCGYGWAYRVLDAQHFGVPQRRRRVFVVGHLGDWRRAAAVLFERHSLSGNPPPRRQAGKDVARSIRAQSQSSHREDSDNFVAVAHSLRAEGFDASEDGTGRGTPLVPVAYSITPSNSNKDYNAREVERSQALTAGGNRPSARGGDLIAFTAKDHGADASDISPMLRSGSHSGSHANGGVMPAVAFNCVVGGDHTTSMPLDIELTQTLQTQPSTAVMKGSAVRRLTPRECERLQGFPDDWTKVPYRGRSADECADDPRYKALGNSMCVNVMHWLGQRIQRVENITQEARRAA